MGMKEDGRERCPKDKVSSAKVGGGHGDSGCMVGAKPGQTAMQGFPKELPK